MVRKIISVYKIQSKQTGKIYIGSSTNTLNRWANHRKQTRFHIKHGYSSQSSLLVEHVKTYGLEDLVFSHIEIFDSSENLLERELYWINFYESYNPEKGFNIRNPLDSTMYYNNQTKEVKYLIIDKFNNKELVSLEEAVSIFKKEDTVYKIMSYWQNVGNYRNKNHRKSKYGKIIIQAKNFDPEFDYWGYNPPRRIKPKKEKIKKERVYKYVKPVNCKPIIVHYIDTGIEVEYESILKAVKTLGLVSSKVHTCLKNEFGRYKHRECYFRFA